MAPLVTSIEVNRSRSFICPFPARCLKSDSGSSLGAKIDEQPPGPGRQAVMVKIWSRTVKYPLCLGEDGDGLRDFGHDSREFMSRISFGFERVLMACSRPSQCIPAHMYSRVSPSLFSVWFLYIGFPCLPNQHQVNGSPQSKRRSARPPTRSAAMSLDTARKRLLGASSPSSPKARSRDSWREEGWRDGGVLLRFGAFFFAGGGGYSQGY